MYNKKLQKLVDRAVKSKNKVYFPNFSFTYYIYIGYTYYIYRVRLLLIWQRNLEHRVVGMLLLDYVDELLDDFGMLV